MSYKENLSALVRAVLTDKSLPSDYVSDYLEIIKESYSDVFAYPNTLAEVDMETEVAKEVYKGEPDKLGYALETLDKRRSSIHNSAISSINQINSLCVKYGIPDAFPRSEWSKDGDYDPQNPRHRKEVAKICEDAFLEFEASALGRGKRE